jgi:hypothetical protein
MLFALSFILLYFYPIFGFYIGILAPFLYSWFIIDYLRSKNLLTIPLKKKFFFYLVSLIGLFIAAYLYFNQTLLFFSSTVSLMIFHYSFIFAFSMIFPQRTKKSMYRSMLTQGKVISLIPLLSLIIEPHSTINIILGYFCLFAWLYIFSGKLREFSQIES